MATPQDYAKELSRRDPITFLITQEMFNGFLLPKFQELRPELVQQLSVLVPPYMDVRAVDRTTAEHPYEYNFRITKRHKNGNICREIIMGWREFSIARRLQHRDVVIFSFDANPFQMVVRIPEDRLRPDQRILVPVPNRNRKPKPSIPTCDDAYGAMQALYKMSRSKETYSVPRNVQEGQQQQQMNSGTGRAAGYMGRLHLNDQMYGHFGNTYRGGSGFRLNYHNPESTWNSWQTADFKYESKGRNNGFFGYRITNYDCLMSLARGPRSKDVKTQQEETISTIPDKEQFNKEDIPETYVDAKFFVIKSYGEDNVHKSIKYNVWASTPNGNKKLDAAYQEAKGKPDSCPVFLLFSVNASGQFVGLAEMVGPVDFNNTMDFWLEDKWTGCFPVKWHIVKDVPNSLLKHITLENNDNKPVTNSRDTQEVKLEQGVQVLQIFKSHLTNTSILDDFEFYEARQKALQEKKASRLQCQKQVKNEKIPGDVNVADKVLTDGGKHSCTYGQFKMHQGSAARPQSSADVTKGVNGEKAGSAAEVASA